MENEQVKRFTREPRRSFAEKLALATDEDKQVNEIYKTAIKNNLYQLGGGIDIDTASYVMHTDGLFDCWYITDAGDKEPFLLQMECKRNVDLNDSKSFASVLLQALFYIKQFERAGMPMPKVIVLGTQINCVTIPLTAIYDSYIKNQNYADHDENGEKISASVVPSHHLYTPLLNKICNDADLQTKYRIIEVTDKNSSRELCIDILKAAKDLGIKEDITVDNLARAFDYFDLKVLTKESREKLDSRVKVDAFMQLTLNPTKVSYSSVKDALGNEVLSDRINFNGVDISVEPSKFNAYANLFALKNYKAIDQKKLTEITDRLIEDTDRRCKGDFYTPTIWVDEAYKLLDRNLGTNWKDNYIVWDCAWGTGNLTRDYQFSDLYCSTLKDEDLRIGLKWNPFATKFQYDFLNDDVNEFENALLWLWEPFRGSKYEYGKSVGKGKNKVYPYLEISDRVNFRNISDLYVEMSIAGIVDFDNCKTCISKAIAILKSTKLHTCTLKNGKSLIDKLLDDNGKVLMFLINPPYSAANNMKKKAKTDGLNKETSNTAFKEIMKNNGFGKISVNLYLQFLYRIYRIDKLFGFSDPVIGVFCPTLLQTGRSIEGLRNEFGDFWIKDMFMFPGSEFNGVAKNWAIGFSLIREGKQENKKNIQCRVLSFNNINNGFEEYRNLYNLDGEEAGVDWVKEPNNSKQTYPYCQLSSALNVGTGDAPLGAVTNDYIGYCVMDGNNIGSNTSQVYLLSSCAYHGHGTSVTDDNFDRFIGMFGARVLIESDWQNDKDEYRIPNTEHELYQQYVNDCIVLSILHPQSNVSSLRNIFYNGEYYNIYNEFFWLSREQMLRLANGEISEEYINPSIQEDLIKHASDERYMYKKLKNIKLSDDAKQVLDMATAITIDTFKYRNEFNKNNPDYNINTWDAGWYQIKAVAQKYIPDTYKIYEDIFKHLCNRMMPLVYELGFLYK